MHFHILWKKIGLYQDLSYIVFIVTNQHFYVKKELFFSVIFDKNGIFCNFLLYFCREILIFSVF